MGVRTEPESGIARWLRSLTYYDLVLLLLPVALVLGVVGRLAGSIPFEIGATVSGVASTLLLADALFRNPPVNGRSA